MGFEAFAILLGLAALGFLLVCPALLIVLWTRVRRLEEELARVQRTAFATRRAEAAGAREEWQPAPPRPEPGAPREEHPAARVAPLDIWLADQEPRPQPETAGARERAPARAAEFARRAPGATPPAPPRAAPAEEGFSWEELLAGKWLTWVGAIALVFGAGFFLMYAIEHELIGKRGRLAIGFVAGMSCYAGGAYAVLRRYDWLGQGLIGAALGILYFTLFAGFSFYDELIPQKIAFAGMIAVTASSLAFSAKFDAPATAALGLIGGLATPLMLSRGVDERWVLFPYLFVLNAGVLGVASFRKWPLLNVLAFVGTVAIWIGWFDRYYDDTKLRDALILMSSHFVLFALLAIWHNVLRRIPAEPADFFLILATPTAYFAGLYGVTLDDYDDWHGALALGMAAIYLGLGLLALLRHPAGRKIVLALGGVAVSFLALAVPLQFTGHWVAIAWAAQSVVLFELGLRFREPKLERAGFALLGVVLAILAYYSVFTLADPEDFTTRFTKVSAEEAAAERPLFEVPTAAGPVWTDVINGRSLSFLAAIAALGTMAWEYRRRTAAYAGQESAAGAEASTTESREESPGEFGGLLLAAVPVALLGLLLVESFAYAARGDWLTMSFLALASVWTSAVAFGVVAWSAPRWEKPLAIIGLGAFGLLALFLAASAFETLGDWGRDWPAVRARGSAAAYWRLMLVNPRGFGFLTAIAAAAGAALCVLRSPGDEERDEATRRQLAGTLLAFAYAVGWLMLTVETYAQGVIRGWETGKALSITAVWTLYATATLVAGIVWRSGLLRQSALGLFLLTTVKVAMYDVWYLDTGIRYLAFVGLGVGLLLASWMYRRYRERIRSWIAPALLAALVPAGLAAHPGRALAEEPTPQSKAPELAGALPYRWPVSRVPSAGEAGQSGKLAAIRIPADLYARARGDLGDVRVLSMRDGATTPEAAQPVAVPHVLTRPRDRIEHVERPAEMLNPSQAGTTTEFLLVPDDSRASTNRLTIDVADAERNFVRTVKVFGAYSADPDEWKLLTDKGYLFDRTQPEGRLRVETIDFPQAVFSHLRVAIENSGQPPLELEGAKLHFHEKVSAERREHSCQVVSQERTEDGRHTRVVIDAGHQALPVIELALGIEYSGDFSRSVAVEAGDGEERLERVAWRPVGHDDLLRIDRPDLRADDALLEFPEAPSRWFRLTIADGDDRPLSIASCTARSLERYLVVERAEVERPGRSVAVHSGSRGLASPSYDLARTAGAIDVAALPKFDAGPVEDNPLYKGLAPPGIPWSERQPALLWTITIAGTVVLGSAAFLLLRRASRSDV
ncbi:MAG: DUF2339 domain-containing protein [Planctomycetales bacterium]